MELPESDEIYLNTAKPIEEQKKFGIDKLIIQYYWEKFSCCCLLPYAFLLFFSWFPPFFFFAFCYLPYRNLMIIDEDKKTMIICNRGILDCCINFYERNFFLNNIQKIRLYVTWRPNEKVVFDKLYFMNCEVISLDGETAKLFGGIAYNKDKYDEYATFFRRHFNTDVEPLEIAKNENDMNIITIINKRKIDSDDDININDNSTGENDLLNQELINQSPADPVKP